MTPVRDPDVDIVLTTRELTRMMRSEHITPAYLDESEFDSPLGTGTGAAVIFGATGGVMDAALRSAYFLLTGANPPADAFTAVRGMPALEGSHLQYPRHRHSPCGRRQRAGQYPQADAGAGDAAKSSMTSSRSWPVPAAAPAAAASRSTTAQSWLRSRGNILWELDANAPIRFSHENPDVQALYREYLEKPLGERSHHLLHTDHHAWKMPGEA